MARKPVMEDTEDILNQGIQDNSQTEANELQQEAKPEKPAKASKDPWKQMVTIRLPKATNGEANYLFAAVNGRPFKIQRGVKVDVPLPIAEVIEHSYEQQNMADEYNDSVTERAEF